jgi:CHASE3 domain sensor protein
VQGVLNRISFKFLFTNPGLNTQGFLLKGKDNMQTDYKNLNDRIVKQAWEVSNLTLTEEMKNRLFENKIRRAAEMITAREAIYYKIKD